jgi:NCAIR mutase (PurE)-related protein
MDEARLRALLTRVGRGDVDVEEALEILRHLPFEDLGFAKVDHHRALRNGGAEQVREIVARLIVRTDNIMATRANEQVHREILKVAPGAVYSPEARMVIANPRPIEPIGKVAVLSAGTADQPVAEEAALTAETLGSAVARLFDVGVAGIHRLLSHRRQLLEANVLVVAAGMEGALASVVAGLVNRPVIAVPTSVGYGASFNGLAALLTMLNSCVPWVSVVNIDNGFGAGYQAHMINRMCIKGPAENAVPRVSQ